MLLGRESEQRRIEQLLESVRRGRSAALAIRGEAGIGKTALVRYAVDTAAPATVLSAAGIEAEAELEFSGLLELCRPALGLIDELPEHHAATLRGALGLSPARSQDRFAVGAATLGFLAAAGEVGPTLVVVDDAQWLDPASADAIRFAVRRLDADRVGFVFGIRDAEPRAGDWDGFETLQLRGLALDDARTLLSSGGEALTEAMLARLHAATAGNPLALRELPALLSPEQLAGRAPLAEPLPVGASVRRAFMRRAGRLPEETRRALVLVALATMSDLQPIVATLPTLGLDASALHPAEDAGLVVIADGHIRFGHPLVRSAVHDAAGAVERRAAHAALAGALRALGDPDRGARHLAAAAVGPDEAVASELAAAGARACERSAYSAAADTFELAARLTPDRQARSQRLADAAEAAWSGGDPGRAQGFVAQGLDLGSDPRLRARLLELQGRTELQAGSQARARELLLEAAELLEPFDPVRAATTIGLAVFSCHFAGRIGDSVELGRRLRALVPADGTATDVQADYVLGRSLLLAGVTEEGGQLLEAVVGRILEHEELSRLQLSRVATSLVVLERHDEGRVFAARAVAIAREEGPMALVYALSQSADIQTRGNAWQRALADTEEGLRLARELGQPNIGASFVANLARIAAARGHAADCRRHAAEALKVFEAAGMGLAREQLRCAVALLELGLGRVEEAVTVLEDSVRGVEEMALVDRDVAPEPDLVEALAALGRAGEAQARLDAWVARIDPEPIPWAAQLAARCRGILAPDDELDERFGEALLLHERGGDAFGRARTLLCFGERLRRAGRKTEARERLREAHGVFVSLEATPWSDRARRELRATGERLRRVRPEEGEELTPQELQVALQVADGKTNKEAGAALFLSPKTVEFHLARVYRKLDLSSRAELIRRFAAGEPLAAA